MRTQENHDIFREKLSVTASLQRPRRCQGALMVFYRVPTVFMVEFLCALMVLSLCVHGAHSTCAALSQHCNCADAVLKTHWHLQECRAVSMQTPRTNTVFAQRPLCAPTELLLCCRSPYCAAMVTLRRPLCALLGRRANAEWRCLFWVLKVRTVTQRSMPPHCVQWRCHCVDACVHTARTSAFCNFLGHHGITVRMPPWCDRGFMIK